MATYSRKRSLPDDLAQPLTDISVNTVTSSSTTTSSSSSSIHKKPRLTQMTLDLGQKIFTKCKTCGMDYVLSSDEDRKLHKKFHEAHVEQQEHGIPLTEAALRRGRVVARFRPRIPGSSAKKSKSSGMSQFVITAPTTRKRQEGRQHTPRSLAEQRKAQDTIIEVRMQDHRTPKQLAERVLTVVENELGAVHIDTKHLWSTVKELSEEWLSCYQLRLPRDDVDAPLPEQQRLLNGERYRVYLYVHDGRCVGLLLAERITEGRKVITTETKQDEHKPQHASFMAASLPTPPPSSPPAEEDVLESQSYQSNSPLMATTVPTPALMGISRIWVLSSYRSLGIANMLLETARRKFGYGCADMDEKEEISEAFAAGRTPEVPKVDDNSSAVKTKNGGLVPQGFIGLEKSQIAFSQPTDMGRRFAEKWWGEKAGWLVYD